MSPLISPEQFVGLQEDVVVIDVRHDLDDPLAGLRAYAAGHLPNAAFLSVDSELSGPASPGNGGRHPLPNPEDLAARLAEFGVTEKSLIVAYDGGSMMYAARLWWLCRWIGHLRVAVLDGGLPAWVKRGGILRTDEFKPRRPGALPVRPCLSPRWTLSMVREWVKSGGHPEIATLVDARSEARYRGEVEPYDPVAGHIPGALNRPASQNLGPDGRMKSREQLQEEFRSVIGDADPMAVVHTCGSGISACLNLLAMEAAGLGGSALYPGSWSEFVG